MDRRYQVFVSSTFDDLREERAAAISALLQIDCFPAGMELFPAADDDSLTLIRSVIDDSDYYMVILAGRYGSVAEGHPKSFTQLEYEYAVSVGKPTIALIHASPQLLPAGKTERSELGGKRLDDFREILKKKNCRYWADRGELIAAVFTGIQHLKRTRPGIGWIRGSDISALADEKLKDETLALRREIDRLSLELSAANDKSAPPGSDELAQGTDETTIALDLTPTVPEREAERVTLTVQWDEIFRVTLPQTFGGGAEETAMATALVGLLREKAVERRLPIAESPGWYKASFSRAHWGKIANQMVALGLIEARPHPQTSGDTVWFATPYGVQKGARLVAERRRAGDLALGAQPLA
jgi:hypothetical protein